jgi:hypothetical protein
MTDPQDETYSEAETEARAEAALKRMLATPHKPLKETKSTGSLKRGRPKRG